MGFLAMKMTALPGVSSTRLSDFSGSSTMRSSAWLAAVARLRALRSPRATYSEKTVCSWSLTSDAGGGAAADPEGAGAVEDADGAAAAAAAGTCAPGTGL